MGSYNHELLATSTTVSDRLFNRCLVREKTTNERIHLKASQVESDSCSFVVTYQPRLQVRNENLDGHEMKSVIKRRRHEEIKVEDSIPKQYLGSQDTCVEHVMVILSAMPLSHSLQERLVRYISVESVNFHRSRGGRGGLKIEVDVKVNEEEWVKCDCTCEDKGSTCRQVPETDCPICLNELSGPMGRVELSCSHHFHRDCIMMWLGSNESCPICRSNAIGQTVSLY
ncbi:PREDICTED: peroxisome biogenesis factor 10-like [Camelina sativa]|uniref:RING-type E3 ubiquitin transferase n=1 Tax=Camelina sativa TaxID=90675 RepID=A0ABM0V0C1_CAMSA|nr:PREDICTED: peroxisome biogenesis factor 10-like [Camelina sativa]